MISEVTNALFVTYLATEYSGNGSSKRYDDGQSPFQKSARRRLGLVFFVVLLVNAIDSLTGIGALIREVLEAIYHIPKVFLVMFAYIITLYLDCLYTLRQHSPQRQVLRFWTDYLPRVLRLFLRICPIYPILAVGISFIFLFLISLFELLQIPTHILNAPIYYGTLYGPFSYIYYHVKRDVIFECNASVTLPHHRQIPIIKSPSPFQYGCGRFCVKPRLDVFMGALCQCHICRLVHERCQNRQSSTTFWKATKAAAWNPPRMPCLQQFNGGNSSADLKQVGSSVSQVLCRVATVLEQDLR